MLAPRYQSHPYTMLPILKSLDQRLPEMLATLQQLVELESPSFDKAAVDRLGAHLQRDFERIGGRVTMDPQSTFGNHLLAEFDGDPRGGKPVLLLGHFDTVWDLGTLR